METLGSLIKTRRNERGLSQQARQFMRDKR